MAKSLQKDTPTISTFTFEVSQMKSLSYSYILSQYSLHIPLCAVLTYTSSSGISLTTPALIYTKPEMMITIADEMTVYMKFTAVSFIRCSIYRYEISEISNVIKRYNNIIIKSISLEI